MGVCVVLQGLGQACTGTGQGTCASASLRCSNATCCDAAAAACCSTNAQCAKGLACETTNYACYASCTNYDTARCADPANTYCLSNICKAKLADTSPCANSAECISGTCVSGSCCSGACTPDGGSAPVLPLDLTPYTKVIYIDPQGGSDTSGDGSQGKPFAAWSKATGGSGSLAAGTAYLQKRGTTIDVGGLSISGKDKVLMGAYGDGARPIIRTGSSGGLIIVSNASNVVVRDLELTTTQANVYCLLEATARSNHVLLYNLKAHDATWAIRFREESTTTKVDDARLIGSELYNTQDDCMFNKYADHVEVAYNNIHNCNMKWSPGSSSGESPGDGVQFDNCNNFHVHHNTIDKSSAGNKFAVMIGASSGSETGGLVEYNTLIGPIPTTNDLGGTVIGCWTTTDLVIRYNNILGSSNFGVWNECSGVEIYGNVFNGVKSAIFNNTNSTLNVFHNVFHNITGGATYGTGPVAGKALVVRNNIFDISVKPMSSATASYNLFTAAGLAIGTNNIIAANPLFVDAAGGDFHLQAGSPAIDEGIATSVTVDRESTAIPTGPAPDLGAFESH